MPKLTKERLQQIVNALKPVKPVTSIRNIEREAGLSQSTIQQMISGKLLLTPERIKKLEKVLKKYNL
jgi:plasmid maintenance system antidote protein VapI